ncbi:MAG: epoxyqueuosine reductase QueH [Clostridiales bacterium]|nr:epoxyqueuosine reductase QueH [Clostridiales bacterium]
MINYHQEYLKITKSLDDKPRLLIHSCCAPCSSLCLERVTKFFSVDVFYYNPNITESEEYQKRLLEQQRFVNKVYKGSVKVIDIGHNSEEFLTLVKGLEDLPERSKRCYLCYKQRLEKTAKYAKENGYDYFTTTLSLSPHKNATWLNEIGEELSSIYGVKFLPADFKKENGYLRSIELSNEHNLYRQDFCGCSFSKKQ